MSAKFSKSLPHVRTLCKWYSTIDASPGFMKEALTAVTIKVKEANANGNDVLCNLVLDEMAIRKKVEWDGKKTYGYVDIGTDIENGSIAEAREALVFMLVSVNSHWKIPVGYFLTDGLTGGEKANLLTTCLEFLHESFVKVISITFDEAPSNFAMCNALGANLNFNHLCTFFKHPITNDKIYIFLDPCHMVKLIRNCFGSYKILEDGNGNLISWIYLEKLCELQELEGLHAATRLRKRHLLWVKEKMKVSLAVQTLSKSVAEALTFLNVDLQLQDFQNSEGTANFCRTINNIFDIFNSRNRLTKKPFENPLSSSTEVEYFEYLDKCASYIQSLKLNGKQIIYSNRKVGFLGILICINSLKQLYNDRVKRNKELKYLLTYKLSQDHIEIFFSCIRSKGGYNNNPTSRQLQYIMKKLLIHSEIKGSDTANAVALDSTSILHCSSLSVKSHMLEYDSDSDFLIAFAFNSIVEQDEYFNNSKFWHLTLYTEDIIAYVAGFVVRKLKKQIKCLTCLNILEDEQCLSKLQIRKTYGVMSKASNFVIQICRYAEKCLRSFKNSFNFCSKNYNYIIKYLTCQTMGNLPPTIGSIFDDHLYDSEPMSNHFIEMTKLILEKYLYLRIHHEISKFSQSEERVRSVLTKTILFKNQ